MTGPDEQHHRYITVAFGHRGSGGQGGRNRGHARWFWRVLGTTVGGIVVTVVGSWLTSLLGFSGH